MTTAWQPRMVPGDWPIYVSDQGQVFCAQGDCDEPLGGFAVARRTTVTAFLDGLRDHVTGDHGEAID